MSTVSNQVSAPTTLGSVERLVHDSERRKARERSRALARNARHALLALAILGASAAAVLALRPQPVPVDAVRVTRGELSVVIAEDGVTRIKDRFLVSAPVTGSVARLSLEPGDTVKEGDTLAEIAPALSPLLDERTRAEAEARLGAALSAFDQAKSQINRAAVAKELAEQDLLRERKLFGSGSTSAQSLEQVEFALRMRSQELASAGFASKVASEEVRVARVALGRERGSGRDHHLAVVSPISGRVLRVHQKSAGVVQAGTPLVEVGDPALLEVVVDLLTTDAVRVVPGTAVVIRGWGGDHAIAGRVRRIEPSAFTRPSALGVDEQRVNVVVAFTDPPANWSALGDGFRVETRLVLWQNPSVLKVPQGALFRYGERWALFRLEDGVARLTPVEVGHRGETEAEVTAGVSAGALIAVHPGDRVKDGARVKQR
ncbi:MAG: efflux RND transporter periplasmic adaptor subunit [Myxococcota bacterium]